MLSTQQLLAAAPRRRPLRSLRQQYDLYIMDRIEHYKNSLSREELLRQADEAMVDLRGDEQFLLTEVLAQTAVDEYIKKRLGIRRFDTWRKSFPKLRAAQRDPTHWGLDGDHPVAMLAPRVEPGDRILVVGSGAEAGAYLLSAHDGEVIFLDRDVGAVERAENRVATESLSSTFEAMCVQFGPWLPTLGGDFVLVVLDAGTLASLKPGDRRVLLAELQRITAAGGLHALVADSLGSGPEGLAGHYAAWAREPIPSGARRGRGGSRGALFVKPTATERDAVETDPSRRSG
ncbi:MAG: class I SAM-dependent methyltransferase [Gemmatimonadales bacterium]